MHITCSSESIHLCIFPAVKSAGETYDILDDIVKRKAAIGQVVLSSCNASVLIAVVKGRHCLIVLGVPEPWFTIYTSRFRGPKR
jgi:hypothetical protein